MEDPTRSPERVSDPASAGKAGSKKTRSKTWRRLFVAAQLLLGTGVGLAVAEWAFTKRADGAFPHVNFYVADAELGVRLEAGAQMRFHLHDNPTSEITTNSSGYRGPAWPQANPENNEEVIVIGDSQVFGLGVNDDETFSAKLAEATGRPVLNAGVPTFGPPEYLALARELIELRKPQTLVYTLNFLNDPFELERPNTDRHAVWDGWAVRKETAPSAQSVVDFPGRQWLYSRSHLFYAARRWWYQRDEADAGPEAIDVGVPSEGTWDDLIGEGTRSTQTSQARKQRARAGAQAQLARLESVESDIQTKQSAIDDLLVEEYDDPDDFERRVAEGKPGDIVNDRYSESSRSIVLTAAHINRAARARRKHLKRVAARRTAAGAEAKVLQASREELLVKREKLREQIAAGDLFEGAQAMANQRETLRRVAGTDGAIETGREASVFAPHLKELAALCEQHGVELVVIALPVDVQVSAEEWKKYDVDDGPDMEPSLALLADLTASARAEGARALDATAALRDASPGAFLNGDIHMTAKGHAALASALANTLASPPSLVLPAPGLPEGRSYPPSAEYWLASDEIRVTGSSNAGCSTQIRGDWLRVRCARRRVGDEAATGVSVTSGGGPEVMTLVTRDGVSLTTPLTQGTPLVARFDWETRSRELKIDWPKKEDGSYGFSGSFVESAAGGRPLAEAVVGDDAKLRVALCECHIEVTNDETCVEGGRYTDVGLHDCKPSCRETWGEASQGCYDAYGPNGRADVERKVGVKKQQAKGHPVDCKQLLACSQGDPLSPPKCPEGTIHATATNDCYAPCDALHPCSEGRCTPYNGGGICL
ncbi:MAG: alginate O-acetyltransferase AlgX-related protein [Nannocystales bacterium]